MPDPFSRRAEAPQPRLPQPAPPPAAQGNAARALAGLGVAPRGSFLDGLNPEQREAVETTEGPLLVLAGAGTGKTRVLTARIAHILSSRLAYPSGILSVTFTNKAAREMKERVEALVGPAAEGMPWLGTFHSVAARILRRHAELVGLRSDFTILSMDDVLRLMKQVIGAANIDDKRWPARALSSFIDGWKNRALSPSEVPPGEAAAFAHGKGAELYRAYQARLATLNACDFGDLLLHCIRLFREHPDVLGSYQERFRYILVDEYQDTNVAQYLWLRLLAQGRRNLACVGDDDQSIYGWRGAEVDNILRFEHDFPGAKVVRLERNYRSTGHILAAASGLIAKNEDRLGKTLRAQGEAGEKPTITGCWDSEEEARLLGEEIERLRGQGHRLSEMAVLVRISAQMREIEDRFVTMALPYRVVGGPRFYERLEIRDALAYFRLAAQPADDLAFERVINNPKRGLGEVALQTVHAHARRTKTPLLQAARAIVETEELKPKPRSALRDVVLAFQRWAGMLVNTPHTEVGQTILEESGYVEMWKRDRSADAAGRLDNLKELVRSLEDFPDMASFLEHVSLVMEASEGEGEDRVTLMTLHAAKGLEFDTVFLPGWEEALFPNQRALDENGRAGLEEERRLAYVGLTRARRRAKLYFATNRRIHGLWQATIPSRFIDELPVGDVEVTTAPTNFTYGGYGASRFDRMEPFAGSNYSTPGWKRAQEAQAKDAGRHETRLSGGNLGGGNLGGGSRQGPTPRGPSGGRVIEGELMASSTARVSSFVVGARVMHAKFGPGDVAAVDGNKLTVDFDKAGRKMVLDGFVTAG